MKTFIKFIACVGLVSCQPPSEPASLKSGSAQPPADEGESSNDSENNNSSFLAGGAVVGSEELQKKVSVCLSDKKFFDRSANKCTEFDLAHAPCVPDKINSIMTEKQLTNYKKYIADAAGLLGYKLDQCLDCSDPTSSLCKGTSANPPTAAGVRLFFVKETSPGVFAAPKSLYVIR